MKNKKAKADAACNAAFLSKMLKEEKEPVTREEYLQSLGITHEYIGVRLELGEKAYLERLAERAGMNLSNYVKTAINAYIGENKFTLGRRGRRWNRK